MCVWASDCLSHGLRRRVSLLARASARSTSNFLAMAHPSPSSSSGVDEKAIFITANYFLPRENSFLVESSMELIISFVPYSEHSLLERFMCVYKGSYRSYTAAGKQSFKSTNLEPNQQKSFWSVLAKKAKSVLLDDDLSTCTTSDSEVGKNTSCETSPLQYAHARSPAESKQRGGAPMLQKRLVAFTSSLSSLGGTIGNAIEEGLNIVGQRRDTATKSREDHNNEISAITNKDPIIKSLQQEQSFSKPVKQQLYTSELLESRETLHANSLQQEISIQKSFQQQGSRISDQSAADKETQLKASRDVAMAMATKAKLLLRELKEAKADLAMARDRCAQLEEENKSIRRSLSSGLKLDEEDLVRIQLETLLAEKARLAQENAYYARENQFLREMIEYHRLTMQGGGAFLEECVLEATDRSSDCHSEDTDGFLPETLISTVIS